MNRLSDFKLLERLNLPNVHDINCSGLTLIVGPNSSGKSQLLQDIYHRLSGEPRDLVVAKDIVIKKPDYELLLSCFENEGYLRTITDSSGNKHIHPLTLYMGLGQAAGQIASNQAETWYSMYQDENRVSANYRNEFLNYFGRLLVTALFLERRLISLTQINTIDFDTQTPQHDLHALYLDDEARNALFEEMLSTFDKAVWPDMSRGTYLCLRVSEEGIIPPAVERLSPNSMRQYRTIETEGDGVKSYVAICVALLLGRRPFCLIDEPEMCLHPPQAYNLGRFIGLKGSSPETSTFVATHSSQILRGVIQTAKEVQVIRLTRRGKGFSAHIVPPDVLREAIAKPTLRAESVLDGIFAQNVVILEGDGDRLVYQTTWETLAEELKLDIHFAAVGGTGGIVDTCKLYKALNIPVAIVADLDLVVDLDKLQKLLAVLATKEVAEILIEKTKNIRAGIRKLPPTIAQETLKSSLRQIYEENLDWNNEDDLKVRRELSTLARQLDRMLKLKRGGVAEFGDDIKAPLTELLESLRGIGIFLAPVGELEEWLAAANLGVSKSNKWAWANAASLHIQSKGASDGDIWDFMRSIGEYFDTEQPLKTISNAASSVSY